MVSDNFIAVAKLADLSLNNSSIAIEVEGRKLLLCNADGQIFCVQNRCTHRNFPLDKGRIRRCAVICPEHGVLFDLRSGVPKGELTKIPLKTFMTRIVDGMIEVNLAL